MYTESTQNFDIDLVNADSRNKHIVRSHKLKSKAIDRIEPTFTPTAKSLSSAHSLAMLTTCSQIWSRLDKTLTTMIQYPPAENMDTNLVYKDLKLQSSSILTINELQFLSTSVKSNRGCELLSNVSINWSHVLLISGNDFTHSVCFYGSACRPLEKPAQASRLLNARLCWIRSRGRRVNFIVKYVNNGSNNNCYLIFEFMREDKFEFLMCFY